MQIYLFIVIFVFAIFIVTLLLEQRFIFCHAMISVFWLSLLYRSVEEHISLMSGIENVLRAYLSFIIASCKIAEEI